MASSPIFDDNDRLDCGHYEYFAQAVPEPGGFMICTDCHEKLNQLQLTPEHAARPHGLFTRLSSWLNRRHEPDIAS